MSITRSAAVFSSIAVVVAILAGLYFSGSPAEQRRLRIDERRVQDLIRISQAITTHWEKNSQLPANLPALVDGQRMRSLPTDPETGASYRFEPGGSHSYRLCAEFSIASKQGTIEDFWNHDAGLQCFELALEPQV